MTTATAITTAATIAVTTTTGLDVGILAGQLAPSSLAMYRRDFAAYVAFAGNSATEPAMFARWRAELATGTFYLLMLAVGMAGAGALIGTGFARMRTADRTVSVKGVAEREAKADLAIWPLRLVATDDDLGRANTALERNVQQVRAFLRENGLDSTAAEITVQEFRVEDARTVGGYANTARYIIRQTLVVRSADDPQPLVGEGVWAGEVARAPAGEGGFGYDPLFVPEGFDRPFGELGAEVKNRLSHRARALEALLEWWNR